MVYLLCSFWTLYDTVCVSCLRSSQSKISKPFYLCSQMHFLEKQDIQRENNAGLLSIGNWLNHEATFHMTGGLRKGTRGKNRVTSTKKERQTSLHFYVLLCINVHIWIMHLFWYPRCICVRFSVLFLKQCFLYLISPVLHMTISWM